MINIQTERPPLNRVTAVFTDGSKSFPLLPGATLEQIAERIDHLGRRQERETVAVVVEFAITTPPAAAPQAAPPRMPAPRFAMDCWPKCPGFEHSPDPWLVTPIGPMISCRRR